MGMVDTHQILIILSDAKSLKAKADEQKNIWQIHSFFHFLVNFPSESFLCRVFEPQMCGVKTKNMEREMFKGIVWKLCWA